MDSRAKNIYKKLFKSTPAKTPFSCSVCNQDNIFFNPLPQKYYRQFDKAGFEHSIFLFETLNLFNYTCSHCGAPDRDRLYSLFLEKEFEPLDLKDFKMLDIAPTKHLTDFFLKHVPQKSYRTMDLYMEGVDDKVDIQNMNIYDDNTWNMIICSHVLEHVEDDVKAMHEIYRILKPGGKAILMAPINLGLKKSAEANLERTYTVEERWKYFGQDDHQRLYSKEDFVKRIESVGFKLDQLGINHFGEDIFNEYGINKKSVLYIGEKE